MRSTEPVEIQFSKHDDFLLCVVKCSLPFSCIKSLLFHVFSEQHKIWNYGTYQDWLFGLSRVTSSRAQLFFHEKLWLKSSVFLWTILPLPILKLSSPVLIATTHCKLLWDRISILPVEERCMAWLLLQILNGDTYDNLIASNTGHLP